MTALPRRGLGAAMNRYTRALPWFAGAGLVLGTGYLGLVWWTTTTVPPGTLVSGVDVGGMNRDAAAAALASAATAVEQPVILTDGTAELSVVPSDAGITVDGPASVATVTAGGWRPAELAAWFVSPRVVEPVLRVDDVLLAQEVRELAGSVARAPTEPSLTWAGRRAVLTTGSAGRSLDMAATRDLLRAAVAQPRLPITLPVRPLPPSTADDEARLLQSGAQRLVDQPPAFRSGSAEGRLGRRILQRAITFQPRSGALTPVVDGELLARRLTMRFASFEVPAVDARFRIRRGTPQIVPGKPGSTIDPTDLARRVADAVRSPDPVESVDAARLPVEPDLTDTQARQLGVTERLSSFTQRFPYAPYRVQNIGRAARYVDGTLLMPGETFSMNDVIRERTVANGYTTGIVIGPGGVFAEDLGGGVSAATTAVWTAAFFAGLERVETRAHSIYISRYQPGLEATVAWGVFDMRFRNDTPNAVLITAKTTNTTMTVRMWGTRVFDEIRAEFGDRTNTRPHATVRSSSPSCTSQNGMDGFDIVVDRVFVSAGVEVAREPISTSYRPSPDVICARSR